jgi:hypothetical protein
MLSLSRMCFSLLFSLLYEHSAQRGVLRPWRVFLCFASPFTGLQEGVFIGSPRKTAVGKESSFPGRFRSVAVTQGQ